MLSNFVTNCFNVASVEFTGFFFLSKLFWLPAHWTTWLLLGGRINTSRFLEFCTCIRKRIAPFCSKGKDSEFGCIARNIRNFSLFVEKLAKTQRFRFAFVLTRNCTKSSKFVKTQRFFNVLQTWQFHLKRKMPNSL